MFTDPRITAFRDWLDMGPFGTEYVYHTGNLAIDREKTFWDDGTVHVAKVEPYETLGLMALNAYQRGEVLLVQRRERGGTWNYVAVKRGREVTDKEEADGQDVEQLGVGHGALRAGDTPPGPVGADGALDPIPQ